MAHIWYYQLTTKFFKLFLPNWPVFCNITINCKMEDLVEVNYNSEDIADGKN